MIQITKEQAEYLIKIGALKCVKGRYPDLSSTCKNKSKGKRKKRYVNRVIFEKYLKDIPFKAILDELKNKK